MPKTKVLWMILAFALLMSLIVVAQHRNETSRDLYGDSPEYHRLAVSLIANHVFDSTYRPPAYPAFVAIVYAVAGPKPVAVYLVQALIFVTTLFLVFKIALHITRSERVGLMTVLLCAVWPQFYSAIPQMLTEILSAFLVALSIWCILRARETSRLGWCISAGILAAANVLSKSALLPFAVLVPLFVVFPKQGILRGLLRSAVIGIGLVIVLLPWTVRNYRVTHKIIPVSTGGGLNFWIGNWPGYHERVWDWKFPPEIEKEIAGKSEVERDTILMRHGKDYIKEDPVRAIVLFTRKFSILWLGGVGTNAHSIASPVPHIGSFAIPKMVFMYVPLFVLAIFGWIYMDMAAKRRAIPLITLLIIWTFAYVVFTAERRYAIPVRFYELFLAVVALNTRLPVAKPVV